MTTIVTRAGKGSALSYVEMDANFTNLNTNKLETIDLAPYETSAHAAATYETIANTTAGLALKSNTTTTVTKDSSTGAGALPVGTTAQRPASPANGYVRYNTDTSSYEGYKNGNWLPLGGGATGAGTNDVFYENSITVTADYTITTNKNAMSAGPISVATGVTVTIPTGSVWSIV